MAEQPDFKLMENLATTILLSQSDINMLTIDVMNLEYDYKIYFDSMQNYCKITGCSWQNMNFDLTKDGHTVEIDETIYLVLYNQEYLPERINWTLAHEIGHIYAKHDKDSEKEEIEAHFFAAQLLMPEAIIRKLIYEFGFLDYGWIYSHFYVSLHAAMKRVVTLNNKFFTRNKKAIALQNKFANPMQQAIKDFWDNPEQFHLNIYHAHALAEDMETPYKECYMIEKNPHSKKSI